MSFRIPNEELKFALSLHFLCTKFARFRIPNEELKYGIDNNVVFDSDGFRIPNEELK